MKSDARVAFDFVSSVANLSACMHSWVVVVVIVVLEHCAGTTS